MRTGTKRNKSGTRKVMLLTTKSQRRNWKYEATPDPNRPVQRAMRTSEKTITWRVRASVRACDRVIFMLF